VVRLGLLPHHWCHDGLAGVRCLDSQRVEANEAFGNTSHTIPGSSCNGRPAAAQQAFKGIKYNILLVLTTHRAKGTEPRLRTNAAAVHQHETHKSEIVAIFKMFQIPLERNMKSNRAV